MVFDSYMNKIINLNSTDPNELVMNKLLLNGQTSFEGLNTSISNPDQRQKELSYLLMNGLRSILQTTLKAEDQLGTIIHDLAQSQDVATFLALMILGLLITLGAMGLLGNKIIIAESSKQEVLGLFGELTPDEIAETFASCERYMEYMDNFHTFTSGKGAFRRRQALNRGS